MNVWRDRDEVVVALERARLLERRRDLQVLSDGGQRAPPRRRRGCSPRLREQDRQVVEDVGGLLGHALVGLLARGADDLLGLLLDLLADQRRVGEQLRRVGALGALLRARRASAPGRAAPRAARRLEVAGEEAGALAGVAGGAGGLDQREHGVGVAVEAQRLDRLRVARRSRPCATARRASGCTGAARRSRALQAQRLLVHVGERQHLAGAPVLDDARHEAALVEDVGAGRLHRSGSLAPESLAVAQAAGAPAPGTSRTRGGRRARGPARPAAR